MPSSSEIISSRTLAAQVLMYVHCKAVCVHMTSWDEDWVGYSTDAHCRCESAKKFAYRVNYILFFVFVFFFTESLRNCISHAYLILCIRRLLCSTNCWALVSRNDAITPASSKDTLCKICKFCQHEYC